MSAVPGTLDTGGFGPPNGYAPSGFSGVGATTVATLEQPDGKIVVGSQALGADDSFNFALSRLNSNGRLDTSFGTKGTVLTAITHFKSQQVYSTGDLLTNIFYQPNGDILALGISYIFTPLNAKNNSWTSTSQYITMAEYKSNGTLDTSFGTNGVSQILIVADSGIFAKILRFSAATVPDPSNPSLNDIVVAIGRTSSSLSNISEIARFAPTGQLDPTFGSAGTGIVQLSTLTSTPQIIGEPDSSVLVAGTGAGAGQYIEHYLPNGTYDATFGQVSVTLTSMALQPGPNGALNAVLALPGTPGELERYNLTAPDGGAQTASLDSTFGVNGLAVFPSSGSTSYSTTQSPVVQPQIGGDIIVSGISSANGSMAPIAFTAAGAVDTSYGPYGDGIGQTDPIGNAGASVEGVSGQTGYGDLLVAGGGSVAVARYTAPTTITSMAMANALSASSLTPSMAPTGGTLRSAAAAISNPLAVDALFANLDRQDLHNTLLLLKATAT